MRTFPVIAFAVLLAGAALTPGTSRGGNDPGTPKGKASVPTETLPTDKALRALEEQDRERTRQVEADYIKAQRGFVYFASAPLPAVDRNGAPVIDPKTHRQVMDGFCIVWRTRWVLDNPDQPHTGRWYTGLSFTVDPRSRQLTVYELKGPNGVATPTGFEAAQGQVSLRTDIVVPLYEQPQPGWDCSQETWISVLMAQEHYIPPIVTRGVTSADPYRYRE
jgi:hypothetical protein